MIPPAGVALGAHCLPAGAWSTKRQTAPHKHPPPKPGTAQSGTSASWWGREGSPHPRACFCMRTPSQPNPTPPPPPTQTHPSGAHTSHILDAMACEGCRHLRDVEDDPGTGPVAKSHSVGVPRAVIPKADSAHSAHGAGRSEEDLYSGLSALEAARSGTGGRRRLPSDVKSLILRTQDLAELPPDELDHRITLMWRYGGVMLHLRSTHPGIGPVDSICRKLGSG